jgi:Holliday junction resolvase RusA-like endonuclease
MKTILQFTVPIAPIGKQRARTYVAGYKVGKPEMKTVTPKATKDAEKTIRIFVHQAMVAAGIREPITEGALMLIVVAFFRPAKLFKMDPEGMNWATTRSDADNVAKLVADALNGLAYDDDRRCSIIAGAKRYDETPRIMGYLMKLDSTVDPLLALCHDAIK